GVAEFSEHKYDDNKLQHASLNYAMRILPAGIQTKSTDLRYAALLHMMDNDNNQQRFALSCATMSFFPVSHGLSFQTVPSCMQADTINTGLCFHDKKLLSSTTATLLYNASKKTSIAMGTI
ncbi:MAG: hypothetical protein R8K21_04305, partial [Mariprofundales bacterium]